MIDATKTGRLIALCRKDANFTQDELASKLGVTPQAVSRWERGGAVPDIDLLLPLAKFFNITVETLLTGERTPYGNEPARKISASPSHAPAAIDLVTPPELAILISTKICNEEDDNFTSFMRGLLDGVAEKRRGLAKSLGIIMPMVNIRDDMDVKENEYVLCLKAKEIGKGEFSVSDPSAPTAIANHLRDTVKKEASRLMNRDMAKQLADAAAVSFPVTVGEIVPEKISYLTLAKLLAGILDEGKPINDLRAILELAVAEDLTDIKAVAERIAGLL